MSSSVSLKIDPNKFKTVEVPIPEPVTDEEIEESISEAEDSPAEDKESPIFWDSRVSWLKYSERIITESLTGPILERIRLLTIAENNLDEFIRTKFATGTGNKLKTTVFTQGNTIDVICNEIIEYLRNTYSINITTVDKLSPENTAEAERIFYSKIYPLLQPELMTDELPIPFLGDGGSFLVTKLEDGFSGIIHLPENHLYRIKKTNIFLRGDDLILHFINKLYRDQTILWNKEFRVFRQIKTIQVSKKKQYIQTIRNELDSRQKANVVMVDLATDISGLDEILDGAKKRKRQYPTGVGFLSDLEDLIEKDFDVEAMSHSRFKPTIPSGLAGPSIFNIIDKKGSVLVHFPYESFELSSVRFLEEAANDPNVKVIKQTLYRVGNSPIIEHLCKAAKNGKQVIVLLELKAKMDEETNLELVDTLKDAGCRVIFGPLQMKTHAKITLVIREKNGKLEKYCNISTGNFNSKTAKCYEDLSYFTKDTNKYHPCEDLCDLFVSLGGSSNVVPKELIIAPYNFRSELTKQIDTCITQKLAKPENDIRITIKCNSFTDEEIGKLLYKASSAGVKVDLLVRGMCIIKAGIRGLSENINVKSIVGRFLEHSRIYQFDYIDSEDSEPVVKHHTFIGSGDVMPRNLDFRIEAFIPIKSEEDKNFIANEILNVYLDENTKAWIDRPTGDYERIGTNDAQTMFIEKYNAKEKDLIKN